MDPTVVFKRLIEALEHNDNEEASEAARALEDWLDGNGFAPKMTFHELSFIFATLADLLEE